MIIETHIHLYDERYQKNLDEVIKEALDNDVKKIIVVGFDKKTSYQAVEMANKYPFLYASIGLHPSEVLKEKDNLSWIDELINNKKVVAIGEIGLDYYWDKTFVEEQKDFFKKQIKLAIKYNKPIIVHSREAIQDTYDILKNEDVNGVIHCFSSSKEMALEFIKKGFYIGIGGVVTFKNSKEMKEVVKSVPLKNILSETDAPYLAPEPYRGKINKPSYLPLIIQEIALLKGLKIQDVEEQLQENAEKLFKI